MCVHVYEKRPELVQYVFHRQHNSGQQLKRLFSLTFRLFTTERISVFICIPHPAFPTALYSYSVRLSDRLSITFTSFVRGRFCPGGLCPGGFCPGGILSVSRRSGASRGIAHSVALHRRPPPPPQYLTSTTPLNISENVSV